MKINHIYQGDVLEVLKTFPDEAVHCCVTSPPYWGLRDYGIEGQLGLEKTPEEYIEKMVEIFREVRRVLRSDGTLWLNMGDSYMGSGGPGSQYDSKAAPKYKQGFKKYKNPNRKSDILKPKDLVGLPWMLAFALRNDGWWLRSDIIWAKPNPMPESVRDRPTKSHEYMFLLSKSKKYYYDQDAVREKQGNITKCRSKTVKAADSGNKLYSNFEKKERYAKVPGGRNLRDVWTIATQPFPEAHFATFPEKLVEPCIKAGTSEKGCCPVCGEGWERIVEKTKTFESGSGKSGNPIAGKQDLTAQPTNSTPDVRKGPVVSTTTIGWQPGCRCVGAEICVDVEERAIYNEIKPPVPAVVLDPFMGSGRTALVARKLGRNYVGIELNPEYIKIAEKQLQQEFLWS